MADSSTDVDPSVSLMVGTGAGVFTEHVAFLHDLALDPLSTLSAENSSHLYRNGLRVTLAFCSFGIETHFFTRVVGSQCIHA